MKTIIDHKLNGAGFATLKRATPEQRHLLGSRIELATSVYTRGRNTREIEGIGKDGFRHSFRPSQLTL